MGAGGGCWGYLGVLGGAKEISGVLWDLAIKGFGGAGGVLGVLCAQAGARFFF